MTTSKLLLLFVMFTYFIGVALGGFIVWRNPDQLSSYLTYIGSATGLVIGFYVWKAKAENIIKIQKSGIDASQFTHM